MRLCHAAGQSVIGAGGLTGLVHAADATPDDILISFERMTAIESIGPVGRTLSVQSGAQLQKVQEAAREQKLLFAVDLGAQGSATIGGTMSTNAGGNQVVRRAVLRLHPPSRQHWITTVGDMPANHDAGISVYSSPPPSARCTRSSGAWRAGISGRRSKAPPSPDTRSFWMMECALSCETPRLRSA